MFLGFITEFNKIQLSLLVTTHMLAVDSHAYCSLFFNLFIHRNLPASFFDNGFKTGSY